MKHLEAQSTMKVWLSIAALLAVLTAFSCGSSGGYGGNSMGPYGGGGGGGGTTKELNSGNIGAGGTYTHRFATAGTFNYHCIYHSVMKGSVVVSNAAVDTLVNVSIASSTSPFPGATVKTGGRVHWTNNTSMTHTVTSN